jgi:hypothetical protein
MMLNAITGSRPSHHSQTKELINEHPVIIHQELVPDCGHYPGSIAGCLTGGDTDPDGVKLMLLHEDPEFKAALKEKSGGAENSTDWAVVCTAELLTLVGAIIWEARRKQDHCARVTKSDWGAGDYCVTFSNECNHYQWDSNCLLDKRGEYYCDDH